MKPSIAQSLKVSYMVILYLVTLQIITVDSALMRSGHEVGSEDNTPIRRRRADGSGTLTLNRRASNIPPAQPNPKTVLVVVLVFILIFLILALAYFYKRLNREADGEYTLTNLVNGARERTRNAKSPIVISLRGLLGSRTSEYEDEEQGWEEEDEEEDEEESREEVSLEDAKTHTEEERRGEADSSDDFSSTEGFQPQEEEEPWRGSEKGRRGERTGQEKMEEKKTEVAEVMEEETEKQAEGQAEGDQGREAGAGLQEDLKEFSGSAISAEEVKNEGYKDSIELTEL